MVKYAMIALLSVAVLCCAGYQGANMWMARNVTAPGSLATLLPPEGASTAAAFVIRTVRQPYEARFAATVAVTQLENRGDAALLAQTQMQVDALPDTSTDNALRARLAVLRGDRVRAFDTALLAGQMDIVHDEITYATRHEHIQRAISLEERVIARFAGERTQRETLAEAYWQLGVLENLAASRAEQPQPYRIRARDAFEANVLLTPLSGRALLSAGYAELALGNPDRAQRCFTGALTSDPASASAIVGLARIALLHNDRSTAAVLAARARALAPAQSDVQRLEATLHS